MVFGIDNYASQSQSQSQSHPLPRDSDWELEHKRNDAREGEENMTTAATNFHPCWLVAGLACVPVAMFGVLFTIGPTMVADVCCFFSRKRDSFRMGLVASLRIFHARRCRRSETGRNINDTDDYNDKHMDQTETETSLATEAEDDIKIDNEPFPRREEEEEEEFLVRLGFQWNGVSYVANHEESVSEIVYQQLLAEKEQITHNNNTTTLPIVALLRHKTLLWNDGSLLTRSRPTVVVGVQEQEYYSKSLLGDDHHCGNRLTKLFFFSCATVIPSFALAIMLGARSNLEFVGTFLGHLLVGILLASYLQYRWWERNLRNYYRVVVVDGSKPPTIVYDESNKLERGPSTDSTSHGDVTTINGVLGTTLTIDSTAGYGEETSHATMDGLFGSID